MKRGLGDLGGAESELGIVVAGQDVAPLQVGAANLCKDSNTAVSDKGAIRRGPVRVKARLGAGEGVMREGAGVGGELAGGKTTRRRPDSARTLPLMPL